VSQYSVFGKNGHHKTAAKNVIRLDIGWNETNGQEDCNQQAVIIVDHNYYCYYTCDFVAIMMITKKPLHETGNKIAKEKNKPKMVPETKFLICYYEGESNKNLKSAIKIRNSSIVS